MKRLREFSWLRILSEGAIIVISILLAFAIDAWWDRVQYRERQHQVYANLEAAFSDSLVWLDENIELSQEDLYLLRRFIEMDTEDAAKIPVDSNYDYLRSIWMPGTEISNGRLLDSMLNDSNLDPVTNPKLQTAVAMWRRDIAELQERGEQLARTEGAALSALGRHAEVRIALAQSESGIGPGVSAEAMRKIKEDPNVMAIAARKALQANIHLLFLRKVRTRVEQVLERLGEEKEFQ